MATITPDSWLNFLQSEYLESFIRDGGASVKFAVPLDDGLRSVLEEGIVRCGERAGFIVASVSSADTRVHSIDQVLFRITEQVPWRELSERVLTRLARSKGYAPPEAGSGAFGQRLADANGLDVEMLLNDMRPAIQNDVFRNAQLAKDFRIAATHLCMAELTGGPDGQTRIDVITDWLTGRNRSVGAVRPYQIFSRITRNNSRHLFESLLLWIRFAGLPGLVIVLDIARLTIPRNPQDGLLHYSKAAMFNAYELLRQFIDSTDRMKGCLLIVTPAQDFLDVEPYGRGMGSYDALKLRVYDEVRDQRLVNPMGALVRLTGHGAI